MDDTSTLQDNRRSHKHHLSPEESLVQQQRPHNIVRLVANSKKNNNIPLQDLSPSQATLIKLTRKLAEDAESGKLTSLALIGEYEDQIYTLGLEGSYLEHPESVIEPLMRLQWRIMNKVEVKE